MGARVRIRTPHRSLRGIIAGATIAAIALPALMGAPFASAATGRAPAHAVDAPLTRAMAARLSQSVDRPVIVLLRTQLPAAQVGSRAMALRTRSVGVLQAPLLAELHEVAATHVRSYRLVDALAATVSSGEVARLRDDPAVREVIPDVVIHGAQPDVAPAARSVSRSSGAPTASLPLHTIPGACSSGTPQLAPEGLGLTNTDSTTNTGTARALGLTGAGVKVAYIADGVDPNNVNFIRPDGSPAFVDYQDFSGDGPGQPTSGDEAFLDANTIAGQGIHTYDVSSFSAQADPTACNIRIEGVAPGASLVGLDVFGTFEDTTESNFLQAIDYAVETDHVNVLNESFGSNPFPDVSSLDATKLFDDAAVAAGVTVTVSSGDAGPANTIGSPASDPNVISVGASTQLQFYAQTNYEGTRYFAGTGWIDNNISALSSSGFDETGNTVDLVAPGDLSFASCDASPEFAGCVNFKGQSSDVEESGGTSESSPFVAGAAALVIQAYRQTHGGATPTPALVKQILVSTASDLRAPANEQGAGLLNSFKSIQMAESIRTSDGSPPHKGITLLKSVNALNAVALPNTLQTFKFTLTNTGSVLQTLQIRGRRLGGDPGVQTGSVTLNDASSPQFTNYQGLTNNYATFHFTVAPGQSRLNAEVAYPGNPGNGLNARVRLVLIDPDGRLANTTIPQGVGNAGSTDVVDPVSGTWEGVIMGDVAADSGTNGVVPWRVATEAYRNFASISPHDAVLVPGESVGITVKAYTPASPGDLAAAITFRTNGLFTTTLPMTLRSMVDIPTGGAFSGTLTGGNGRSPGEGQESFYEFAVPPGANELQASLSLTNEAGDPVGLYLVAPDGTVQGYGQNSINGTLLTAATATVLDPATGVWTLIADFAEPIVGDKVSQSFSGTVKMNQNSATAAGLPDSASTTLASGTPVTVPVSVTNNGAAPEDASVDPRQTSTSTIDLAPLDQATGLSLPLTGSPPVWFVPTNTSSLSFAASASLPIEFDASPSPGDPDLVSSIGTTATLGYTPSGGLVGNGLWSASPTEIGPYPAPAPAGTVSMTCAATTRAFDPAITSSTGDIELASVNPSATFAPIVIDPGQTVTIDVTITPSAAAGTVVAGTLFVDAFQSGTPPYGDEAVDQVAGLPYEYTVGE